MAHVTFNSFTIGTIGCLCYNSKFGELIHNRVSFPVDTTDLINIYSSINASILQRVYSDTILRCAYIGIT